jgi:N-acetylneuraminic acid mutarotase
VARAVTFPTVRPIRFPSIEYLHIEMISEGWALIPMRKVALVLAVVLAFAMNGAVQAESAVSVKLTPVNNSGISGTARVIDKGSQTEVIITEVGEPSGASEPVHIHEGPCENLNPKPTFPLHNVENGKSDTVVNAPFASIASGRYVINVHQSAANIGTYVACGAIPEIAPSSNLVWTTVASMPSKRSALGVAVGGNGKVYAIGGNIVDSEYPALVEEYDPAKNVWSTRANLLTPRYSLGVVTGNDGNIFAIGGCCGRESLATVEEYSPTTNTWTARASMPTARRALGVAAAPNGKIYAIGGTTNGHDDLKTVEEYNPSTNSWATRASMPTARASLGVVAAPNGKIYAIGGVSGSQQFLASVEEYDPVTNTWTARKRMPTPRASLGVVVGSDGKIYAIGGANNGHEELSTVEEYDPEADTWTAQASLPTPRSAPGVAADKAGKIYVIGGCCDPNGNFLSTVEVATLPVQSQTPLGAPVATATAATASSPTIASAPTATVSTSNPQPVTGASVGNASVTATAVPSPSPVATASATNSSSSVPSIVPLAIILGVVVLLGIILLMRRSATVPPVAPPSNAVGATPPPVASPGQVSSSMPAPSPAPPSSWPMPSSAPYLTGQPNQSPPPPSRPQPAPVPSPWPPSVTPPPTAPPTIFGWSGSQQTGLENLPGGYQIVSLPKNGGMASVFKAYQQTLDRYVAIKVMSPTLTNDPVFVRRFYEEARRTAKLEHPNIVSIYDIGQTPNGSLFIVMRFVDGLSLQELLTRERPLEVPRASRIALQVADALDFAHTWGIIHRDVKPSNIMIEPGDRVTLMDFGIAKLVGDTQLTQHGAIVGTPKYLSPEQAMGQPADHRSDIYALGVVLFEMLTGRAPFEADTPTGMLYAHTSLPPPSPTEINATITPALAAVVLKALAKDRAERYQSARELRQAIRSALAANVDLV